MAPPPEPARVARIIEEVAAEEILPRFGDLAAGEIVEKGPGDLVTIVDYASEARLVAALLDLLPGAGIVGEERTPLDARAGALLAGAGYTWIIDPLDGTHNFAHGNPRFAVIVALARGGETIGGWIYDPLAKRMGVAEKGAGAYLNGARMAVSRPRPFDQMEAIVYPGSVPKEERKAYRAFTARLGGAHNYRCAGHEYLELASGAVDLAVPARLKPWDHAAGVLLHAEAGGYGAMMDGRAYAAQIWSGRLILAPDAPTWRAARAALAGEGGA